MAGAQGMPLVVTQTFDRRYSLGRRAIGFIDLYRPALTVAACMKSSRYSQKGSASPRCPTTIRSRGNLSKTPAVMIRSRCIPVSTANP